MGDETHLATQQTGQGTAWPARSGGRRGSRGQGTRCGHMAVAMPCGHGRAAWPHLPASGHAGSPWQWPSDESRRWLWPSGSFGGHASCGRAGHGHGADGRADDRAERGSRGEPNEDATGRPCPRQAAHSTLAREWRFGGQGTGKECGTSPLEPRPGGDEDVRLAAQPRRFRSVRTSAAHPSRHTLGAGEFRALRMQDYALCAIPRRSATGWPPTVGLRLRSGPPPPPRRPALALDRNRNSPCSYCHCSLTLAGFRHLRRRSKVSVFVPKTRQARERCGILGGSECVLGGC